MKNVKKQSLKMAPNEHRDLRTRPHYGGMQMASSLLPSLVLAGASGDFRAFFIKDIESTSSPWILVALPHLQLSLWDTEESLKP